jgi:hypothetical protein
MGRLLGVREREETWRCENRRHSHQIPRCQIFRSFVPNEALSVTSASLPIDAADDCIGPGRSRSSLKVARYVTQKRTTCILLCVSVCAFGARSRRVLCHARRVRSDAHTPQYEEGAPLTAAGVRAARDARRSGAAMTPSSHRARMARALEGGQSYRTPWLGRMRCGSSPAPWRGRAA